MVVEGVEISGLARTGTNHERIRRDKRELHDRSSDDSSSDQDSCGSGSTSEANDIFDTLGDHLGYGSDSGFGW